MNRKIELDGEFFRRKEREAESVSEIGRGELKERKSDIYYAYMNSAFKMGIAHFNSLQ